MKAKVAFSPETPLEPAYGGVIPVGGRATSATRSSCANTQAPDPVTSAGSGTSRWSSTARWLASREVPADGREHDVEFTGADRAEQLGALRQFPAAAHEPGQRARRGQADPRVARERAVGARLHRSALARARAADCAGRARRGGKGLRRGEGDLPPDRRGVADRARADFAPARRASALARLGKAGSRRSPEGAATVPPLRRRREPSGRCTTPPCTSSSRAARFLPDHRLETGWRPAVASAHRRGPSAVRLP